MKSNKFVTFVLLIGLIAGCGGGGGSSNSSDYVDPGVIDTSPNVVAITVPPDQSYPNKATVSVTVCNPDTGKCHVVGNVLLDTGSYGLRLFNTDQVASLSLQQVAVGSAPIAECVPYLDGTATWGPIKWADVRLGGETSSNIPIQIIDPSYASASIPGVCNPSNVILDKSPDEAGYNGILGVGLFAEDCGPGCASIDNNGNNDVPYFTCNGSNCTGIAVPVEKQVQNPVAHLGKDYNNGVIVQMNNIPLGGARTASGKLILGIGTKANNTLSGVTAYPTTPLGDFTTVFNGTTLEQSFIDSGSNGLFFPAPASLLPPCATPNSDWYCPPVTLQSPLRLQAVNYGNNNQTGGTVPFSIGKATTLFGTSNSAFSELGGPAFGSGFDWGLPFFYGRSVAVGIEGTSSSLGIGPYWAY